MSNEKAKPLSRKVVGIILIIFVLVTAGNWVASLLIDWWEWGINWDWSVWSVISWVIGGLIILSAAKYAFFGGKG